MKTTNRELRIEDFSFTGPLGCQGATIEKIGRNHFKVIPGHAPEHPEWANMVNFTIKSGARGNSLRLETVFDGGSKMRFNAYSYSWSYDGLNWRPVHWEKDEPDSSLGDSLLFPVFDQDTVYVGHQVPMSYEQLVDLADNYEAQPGVEVVEIGQSLEGRAVMRIVVSGDEKADIPVSERFVHYFANQHPGEHNAQWRMVGMIDWLLRGSEEAKAFLRRQTAHFLLMMSPDSPSRGWYRVNGQGVDMNRSYSAQGSDRAMQAHEAFIAQSDLEQIAFSSPLRAVWSHHTWGGVVEPLISPGRRTENEYGPWTDLRDHLLAVDNNGRIKPLKQRAPASYEGSWVRGPNEQFGVSAVLCEGAGHVYLKEDCLDAGRALMQGIARYCTEG